MPASNTPSRKKSPSPPPSSPAAKNPPPAIHLRNLQRPIPLNLRAFEQAALRALPLLGNSLPTRLRSLEISFVSPRRSGRLHLQHLGDPAPTDVITYDLGAAAVLVLCPAVAEQQRKNEKLSLHDELLTYLIHGLLHLCGHDDHTPRGYQTMRRRQSALLHRLRS